jgi:hypothetical protein
MVSTRSRATQLDPAVSEPPTKRVKLAADSSPDSIIPRTTSSNISKPPSKTTKKPTVSVKKVSRKKLEEPEESQDAVALRKRNIGKRYSPGDGQFDYALSAYTRLDGARRR